MTGAGDSPDSANPVEVPQLQFFDQVVNFPVVAQIALKTIEIPQSQFLDTVVDVPVLFLRRSSCLLRQLRFFHRLNLREV